MSGRVIVVLLSMLMLTVPAAARPPAKTARRMDWTHVVAATPAGGSARQSQGQGEAGRIWLADLPALQAFDERASRRCSPNM